MPYERYLPIWEPWRAYRAELRRLELKPTVVSEEQAKTQLRRSLRYLDRSKCLLKRRVAQLYKFHVVTHRWIGRRDGCHLSADEWGRCILDINTHSLYRFMTLYYRIGMQHASSENLDIRERHRIVEKNTLRGLVLHYPSCVFNTLRLYGVDDQIYRSAMEAFFYTSISLTKAPRLEAALQQYGNPHEVLREILPDLVSEARKSCQERFDYSTLFQEGTSLLNKWLPAQGTNSSDVLGNKKIIVHSLSQGDTVQMVEAQTMQIDPSFAEWEARQHARELLSDLTPRQRVCIKLDSQGLEVKEIALEIGCKPETVKWHLAEARKRLKDRIEK